jgi:hypothetical protein
MVYVPGLTNFGYALAPVNRVATWEIGPTFDAIINSYHLAYIRSDEVILRSKAALPWFRRRHRMVVLT